MSPYPIDTPLDFNRDTLTEGIERLPTRVPSRQGAD